MKLGLRDHARMSPEQREVADSIALGPRGKMATPFYAMMDSPRLAQMVQEVGAYLRFNSSLDARLRELAVVSVAATVGSGIALSAHTKLARELGLDEAVIALASNPGAVGTTQGSEAPDLAEDVIAFARSIVAGTILRPENADLLIGRLGRSAFCDLVALCGYYRMLACYTAIAGIEIPIAVDEDGEVETDRAASR